MSIVVSWSKSKPIVFTLAFVLRLVLVIYGLWQDNNFAVKYTDIDYEVLTDGARYIDQGGSPYERSTYRYTPLLAYMLLPNIWFSKIFGKLIFLACDLLIGYLLLEILKKLFQIRRSYASKEDIDSNSLFYTLFWLFNPIAMNVSTRGNAESLVGALVLLTIYLIVVKRNIILGGICYGLAIHFKIYPIVYSLALFLYVDSWRQTASNPSFLQYIYKTFINPRRIAFAAITVVTLAALTAIFYRLCGWTFLYETYLYHLVRKDNRHNFSVYFYHIYLAGSHQIDKMPSNIDELVNQTFLIWFTKMANSMFAILCDFGPQLALLLTITFAYYKDITFCILLQTMTFVAFNKVCTVQYFCWYFSLLPLALPWNRSMPISIKISLPTIWMLGQALWLWFAYRLEFLAENTFFSLWMAGIIYFIINVAIIVTLVIYHNENQADPKQATKQTTKQNKNKLE